MSSVTAVPLRPIAKGALTKLWLGVGLLVAVAGGLAYAGTSGEPGASAPPAQYLAWNGRQSGVVTTPSGLQYKILEPGSGPKPTDEDVVSIGYKGQLRDGSVFDQAPSAQAPVAQMVPGFAEALKLMPKGAKFRVWLPPKLAYGDRPPPGSPIPADAVLIFDIEMHQFVSLADLQREMMARGMGGGGAAPGGEMAPPGGQPDPHGGR